MSKPYVRQVKVTYVVDTAALALNDVAGTTQKIPGVANTDGGEVRLIGFDLHDKNDQAIGAYDVLICDTQVTIGTVNSGITIADDDAERVIHSFRVPAGNAVDLVNSIKYFCAETTDGLVKSLKCQPGTRDLWFGLVVRSGTPTFASGQLFCTFYFEEVL
jgi:hypothetical protein